MISAPDRQNAVELISETIKSGTNIKKACSILGISARTYQRWVKLFNKTGSYADLRPTTERNATTSVDRNEILKISHSEEFADLPPCEIIPILADREVYIASESTFYHVKRMKIFTD